MKTNIKTKLNQAFSLVELLVVIAVIAVIAAIAIPNITGVREAAVQSQTTYNSNAVTRFLDMVNAQGAGATRDQITNGYSWVNTNLNPPVTNTFTQ